MSRLSSFGTTATGIVRFGIIMPEGSAAAPDWSSPETYVQSDPIPGSDPPIVERALIATGDATVTWSVDLASREDLRRLQAKRWSSDILTVPANMQSHIGTYEHRPSGPVEHLPHTLLTEIARVRTYPDGTVEAELTFLRLIDPATGEVIP